MDASIFYTLWNPAKTFEILNNMSIVKNSTYICETSKDFM